MVLSQALMARLTLWGMRWYTVGLVPRLMPKVSL
jgi:hypothetical protein